jgi:hypothetical protein
MLLPANRQSRTKHTHTDTSKSTNGRPGGFPSRAGRDSARLAARDYAKQDISDRKNASVGAKRVIWLDADAACSFWSCGEKVPRTLFMNFLQMGLTVSLRVAENIMTCLS